MTRMEIAELVREYLACSCASEDSQLRLVDAAIFVEECFGLVLSDADMAEANLGSPEALVSFVAGRMKA